ncbi:hypothetical protein Sru01_19740 [Sphaerisporangium rufum]|uniref:Uncharacterized protein n=1 Tax=Sphaerisporangium rufum TaxID=1381558 RepID=A0A919V045_9ACTN|nr:hypothetical protein [Sphaerisporangium rufum]GII76992.1 hypothetical protein Sru01_19740 [Sphaerisporangium rufum]
MVTSTNRDTPDAPRSEGRVPRRGIPRPLFVAATAVLLTSGGIGVAAASAGSPVTPPPVETPTPTASGEPTPPPTGVPTPPATDIPTPTPPTTPSPTPPPVSTARPTAHPLQFSGALHGEATAGTKDPCVFVTVLAQTGEATVVSEDSLTVRSADGFEQTYALSDATRVVAGKRGNGDVRQGDQVSLTATYQPAGLTAAYVYDLSRQPKSRGHVRWYLGHAVPPGPAAWRTPQPCPTPSPTPTESPTEQPTETPPVPTPTGTEVPTPEPTDSATPVPTETAPAPGS